MLIKNVKIILVLRKCFAMFDSGKKGQIEKEKIRTILNTLGAQFDADELEALLVENDVDGKIIMFIFKV